MSLTVFLLLGPGFMWPQVQTLSCPPPHSEKANLLIGPWKWPGKEWVIETSALIASFISFPIKCLF